MATTVMEGAEEMELSLGIDQVSMVLGDFEVPTDCLDPMLLGFSARFPSSCPSSITPKQASLLGSFLIPAAFLC